MELIDNISRLLGDDLKQTLRPGARLKVAASCFSMYAFEALKTELDKTTARLAREKQFNRKVEINAELRNLRTELNGLK